MSNPTGKAIICAMTPSFNTIALIGKYKSQEIGEAVLRLASFLQERGHQVLVARHTGEIIGNTTFPMADVSEIGARADLAIVLGGDGTMLGIACALSGYSVPLVGVNQGRLGFLADVLASSMLETISAILNGQFVAEERILLAITIWRDGAPVCEACAFNDVVVSKSSTGRLIEFEIAIDGQFVYSQRADGLVVATPTGSTAYALSAGGPILHPTLEAFVLVPISPHTLSARPIAVNSHSTVEVIVAHADDARAHFDGQRHFELQINDKVVVRRAAKTIRLLHPAGHNYYDTLRQKLHWGEKL